MNAGPIALILDAVERGMQELSVPGVGVGIIHDGQEHLAGYGVTSIRNPLPVDADTLFQIGSTTKTLTATAIMRLVESGHASLDVPVRSYLPELTLSDPEAEASVTLRHLLTHTAGWAGDLFDDFGRGNGALARFVAAMEQLPQLTAPGTVWSYNNAGFSLAGRVVEVMTGQPFEAAIRELVLSPLGMHDSFFFPEDAITKRVVVGHRIENDAPVVIDRWALPRSVAPAGGLISSLRDQVRYLRFHLGDGIAGDGTRLLSKVSLHEMRSPQAEAGSMAEAVGLPWLLFDADGTHFVGHGGSTSGQMSAFLMVPERGFGLTVLTNAERGQLLQRAITKVALETCLGITIHPPQPYAVNPAELEAFTGKFECSLYEATLQLDEGDLILDCRYRNFAAFERTSPEKSRIAFYAPDRFMALDGSLAGSRGEFLRGPDGTIEWIRFEGRIAGPS